MGVRVDLEGIAPSLRARMVVDSKLGPSAALRMREVTPLGERV
jgi:hypothetical protein